MDSKAFMTGFNEGLDKLAKWPRGGNGSRIIKFLGKAKTGLGRAEQALVGAKTQEVPSGDLLRKALGRKEKGRKTIQMVEKGRGIEAKKGPKEYKELGRGGAAGALAARYGVPAAGVGAAGAGALGLRALLGGGKKKKD